MAKSKVEKQKERAKLRMNVPTRAIKNAAGHEAAHAVVDLIRGHYVYADIVIDENNLVSGTEQNERVGTKAQIGELEEYVTICLAGAGFEVITGVKHNEVNADCQDDINQAAFCLTRMRVLPENLNDEINAYIKAAVKMVMPYQDLMEYIANRLIEKHHWEGCLQDMEIEPLLYKTEVTKTLK